MIPQVEPGIEGATIDRNLGHVAFASANVALHWPPPDNCWICSGVRWSG